MDLWQDLQEAFYICFAPFIFHFLLPVAGGVGMFMAFHEVIMGIFYKK